MSYIITIYAETKPRRYRFVPKYGEKFDLLEFVPDMMEWFDKQPLGKALRRNGILYAWYPNHKSSVVVRDLKEDELLLLKFTVGPEYRIVHESELREVKHLRPVDNYKRVIGNPKKSPHDYDVVKRPRRG